MSLYTRVGIHMHRAEAEIFHMSGTKAMNGGIVTQWLQLSIFDKYHDAYKYCL